MGTWEGEEGGRGGEGGEGEEGGEGRERPLGGGDRSALLTRRAQAHLRVG